MTTTSCLVQQLERHLEDSGVDFDDVHSALLAASVQEGQRHQGNERTPPRAQRFVAHIEGFSLHCGVRVHENDRAGREHLLGYGARGPIALSRLEQIDEEHYRYRMRRPLPDGRTHLVLRGTELIGRLAALVPPPRANLIRFHGVFAPAARMRPHVVPKRDKPTPCPAEIANMLPACIVDQEVRRRRRERQSGSRSSYRLDWASLLRRVFGVDLTTCARCGGRLRIVAAIEGGPVARRILAHLGLPADVRPCAPARGPPQDDLFAG